MSKNTKSKITKVILRKVAIKGAIALATGGAGLLAFEGIELVIEAVQAAEIIEKALKATEIAKTTGELLEVAQTASEIAEGAEIASIAEAAAEVAETTEAAAEVAETAEAAAEVAETTEAAAEVAETAKRNTKIIQDFIGSGVLGGISFGLFKIDIYWDKENIQLNQQVKKIIKDNKKEEIDELNELKRKRQQTTNQKDKDKITKKIESKIDVFCQEIVTEKQVYNSILASVLATFLTIQGSAIGNIMEQIEQKNPSIIPVIEANPELIVEQISKDKNFQDFQKTLNSNIIQETNKGIKAAFFEEDKNYPINFTFSEIDLTFECQGKNDTDIVVKAFKNPAECILSLEDLNSEEIKIPKIGINPESYPDSLVTDIFHMCRCYREYQRLDNMDYARGYNHFRQRTLDGWQSFKNI